MPNLSMRPWRQRIFPRWWKPSRVLHQQIHFLGRPLYNSSTYVSLVLKLSFIISSVNLLSQSIKCSVTQIVTNFWSKYFSAIHHAMRIQFSIPKREQVSKFENNSPEYLFDIDFSFWERVVMWTKWSDFRSNCFPSELGRRIWICLR